MNTLVELREQLKVFYGEHGIYLKPILKFGLALVLLLQINQMVGYLSILGNIFVILILALICAILPLNGTAVICSIVIVGQLFGLGMEVGAAGAGVFLVLYLLYFRFTPKEALALILTPVACLCGMPAVVAMGYGLVGGAFSALSVSCGVFVYYFLHTVVTVVEPLKAGGSADMMASLQGLLSGIASNREMILMILACAAVVIIVGLIRNMEADNIWKVAIVVGMICYMAIVIGGGVVLSISISIPVVIIGTLGAGLVALILEFFLFHVDYKKSEYLQFQDDEYVYFVKAVPKVVARRRQASARANHREPQNNSQPQATPARTQNAGQTQANAARPQSVVQPQANMARPQNVAQPQANTVKPQNVVQPQASAARPQSPAQQPTAAVQQNPVQAQGTSTVQNPAKAQQNMSQTQNMMQSLQQAMGSEALSKTDARTMSDAELEAALAESLKALHIDDDK